MSFQYELGFLGAGNMAEAIAKGAIKQNLLKPSQMIASDPYEPRRTLFNSIGIKALATNEEVIKNSRHLLMAVKPQVMPQAASDLAQFMTADQVVITIMAGINSRKLASTINATRSMPISLRIIRVMPNTPLMSGQGMAGLALGPHAQPGDEKLAMKLFGAGNNKAVLLDESKIDAITAVSGSGPAYVFYLAEAMEKAARELGLEADAFLLVRQTILGSAMLLSESTDTPAELRRKVTSPGGTTEAAIKHMDANKVPEIVVNAIKAAERRSKELGA
jgi:pyrroline-5-carboxylate reductase